MKLISLKKYGKHCSQTLVLSYEQALTGTFLHLQDNILHGYCLASSSVGARRSVSYHSVATRLQRLFKRKGSKVFVLFDLMMFKHTLFSSFFRFCIRKAIRKQGVLGGDGWRADRKWTWSFFHPRSVETRLCHVVLYRGICFACACFLITNVNVGQRLFLLFINKRWT